MVLQWFLHTEIDKLGLGQCTQHIILNLKALKWVQCLFTCAAIGIELFELFCPNCSLILKVAERGLALTHQWILLVCFQPLESSYYITQIANCKMWCKNQHFT